MHSSGRPEPSRVRQAPSFRFERRSRRQQQAAAALPSAALVAAVAYAVLDPLLGAALGGMAGTLVALAIVALPLGALWRVADSGAPTVTAWKTGLLFAFACAALYAWIFTGAWV